jgi:hypothetical protein
VVYVCACVCAVAAERASRWVHRYFFPEGYPESVSRDYWPYQKWWLLGSVAAAANYVLSMQCLLTAVGVGAAAAVTISAGVSWVLKDGLGSVGTMLVAARSSRRFDIDPKSTRWRADILHNIGIAVRTRRTRRDRWRLRAIDRWPRGSWK